VFVVVYLNILSVPRCIASDRRMNDEIAKVWKEVVVA
jgi:hypothetical protein